MAFDFKLTNGDIVISPFDIVLNTKGAEAVAQRIDITLKTFKGEYFLNIDFGAPWFQTVLRKGVSKNLIDTQLKNIILGVEGVLQIFEYESTINSSLRDMTITFKARVDDGIIDSSISIADLIAQNSGAVLLESGGFLLQEDNTSKLLLE